MQRDKLRAVEPDATANGPKSGRTNLHTRARPIAPWLVRAAVAGYRPGAASPLARLHFEWSGAAAEVDGVRPWGVSGFGDGRGFPHPLPPLPSEGEGTLGQILPLRPFLRALRVPLG